MATTIYHNPRCGKSRQTLQLLRDHGIEPTIVEYLKTPPSASELNKLVKLLGIEPRALLRTKEAEYKKLHLDKTSVSAAQILDAMARHPILIERPIVVHGNKAVLGRPPEKVVEIL